jgi:hypothetical protein
MQSNLFFQIKRFDQTLLVTLDNGPYQYSKGNIRLPNLLYNIITIPTKF